MSEIFLDQENICITIDPPIIYEIKLATDRDWAVAMEGPTAHEIKISQDQDYRIEVEKVFVINKILGPGADHGELVGLEDDDHEQYLLVDGTRAADEIRLTPKLGSSGPEGTIFYALDDKHVWVGAG